MDKMIYMKLERQKAIIQATAQLEIALKTFYSEGDYIGLEHIHEQLKDYAEREF